MLADYHVHCMFSDDSWYPPQKVAQDAWRLNLDEICFTDHVDYGVKPDWNDALSARVMDGARVLNVDYDAYFSAIAQVRKEFEDRLVVKTGLEFGAQTHTIGQFNALWDAWGHELDFVLLSIHQVGDAEFWTGDFQRGRTQDEYNHAYYQELYNVATTFEHYSVLAHVDLIKRYDPAGIQAFPAHRDLIAATLEHAIAHNKGIELNTSSFRYGLSDLQPAREILRLYRDLGGEILTLGSDSHEPAHLGAYLRYCQRQLAELGFAGFYTFDHMEPAFHAWDF